MILELSDDVATDGLGMALAGTRPDLAVVFLQGELGAGKSTIARAFLRALGVEGVIKSPTYTLIERYRLADGTQAAHLDFYRIAQAGELDFLGLDDLAASLRLWLVEWPERGAGHLPAPDLSINLQTSGLGRRAELKSHSRAGAAWLQRLSQV